MPRFFLKLFYVILVLFITSCASQQPKLRYFWPSLPDEPKIEYIGVYQSSNDLKTEDLFSKFVGKEESDLKLVLPQMIASNGHGKVFVTDFKLGGVLVFDFITNKVSILGGNDTPLLLSQPSGIAVDKDENIYVAESIKCKIYKLSANGAPESVIDLSSTLKSIGFFTIDNNRKRIIVPDTKAAKIYIVDFKGVILNTITNLGHDDGGFNKPNAVAVSKNGDIFVTDSLEARVVHFDENGKYLSHFGIRGDNPGNFGIINGIAIDSQDHLYISDITNDRITIMNTKGEYLQSFGTTGNSLAHIGVFQLPLGISIDQNDTIFIVEKFWGRFQQYQYLNPAYLTKNPISKESRAKPLKSK